MPRVIVTSFEDGISGDAYAGGASTVANVKHFDVNRSRRLLVPYRAMEADEVTAYDITNFDFYDNRLYGLGKVSAPNNYPKLYRKDDAGDYTTATWEEVHGSLAEGTTSARQGNGFRIYYDGTNTKAYGYLASGAIYSIQINGTPAYASLVSGLTFTDSNPPSPFIHPDDDILYFGFDNKIYYKNGTGSVTQAGLTLPNDRTITDMEKWSNYLAFATKPKSLGGKSIVYLWDRVSADITEAIDFGEGDLHMIFTLGGQLFGISEMSSSLGSTIGRVVIRQYIGQSQTRIIRDIRSSNSTTAVYRNTKAYRGDRVLFGMRIDAGDHAGKGVYSFGYNLAGRLTLTLDYLPENDTTFSNTIQAVIVIRDYIWIAFNQDGSVNRINDQAVHSGVTPTVETDRNPSMPQEHTGKKKQLKSVRVNFTPIPTGCTVTVKYRVDTETSWTTIDSTATANDTVLECVTVNPRFHSIQFQITATTTSNNDIASIKLPFEYVYDVETSESQ